MDYDYELKIPEERVASLIGSKGESKKRIEERTGCRIEVSKKGDIRVTSEDALKAWVGQQIVKAIGRGFKPSKALLLLDEEYSLIFLEMEQWAKTQKGFVRLKGRVIGTNGRTRRIIEELTDCYVSVYGKTIGIIGPTRTIELARHAVESLLEGAQHAKVYRFLEKEIKKIRTLQI